LIHLPGYSEAPVPRSNRSFLLDYIASNSIP